MKKTCSLMLALVLVFLLHAGVTAEETEPEWFECGDYLYTVNADGSATIDWYRGESTSLDIPAELDGRAVTSIGDEAFYCSDSLTGITIPDSVTSIGSNAFFDCSSLTSVTIPASVTSIGTNPFRSCDNLKTILVSTENPVLETIGGVLFDRTAKRLICYPCAYSELYYEIPQGTVVIGDNAFQSSKLTSVTIPESVTSIGDYAFWYCEGLTDVTISEGVTTIGSMAFCDCYSLTEIAIPASVTSIGRNPFILCESLKTITVSLENPVLEIIDGVLFDKVARKLVCYPSTLPGRKYEIPKGTRTIGEDAFRGASMLDIVMIPDSITSIEDYAFALCGLIEITLPDSITSIGNHTFWCSGLKRISIPDSVTSIDDKAFSGCDSLTLTVGLDSYAESYAKEQGLAYTYPRK